MCLGRLLNSLGPTQLKVLSCNLCIATDAVCVSVGTTHVLPSLEFIDDDLYMISFSFSKLLTKSINIEINTESHNLCLSRQCLTKSICLVVIVLSC